MVLSCMTQDWPQAQLSKNDPNPKIALTASPRHIAEQLTLMIAAVYKRIEPRDLVPRTRKCTGMLKAICSLFSFPFPFPFF